MAFLRTGISLSLFLFPPLHSCSIFSCSYKSKYSFCHSLLFRLLNISWKTLLTHGTWGFTQNCFPFFWVTMTSGLTQCGPSGVKTIEAMDAGEIFWDKTSTHLQRNSVAKCPKRSLVPQKHQKEVCGCHRNDEFWRRGSSSTTCCVFWCHPCFSSKPRRWQLCLEASSVHRTLPQVLLPGLPLDKATLKERFRLQIVQIPSTIRQTDRH